MSGSITLLFNTHSQGRFNLDEYNKFFFFGKTYGWENSIIIEEEEGGIYMNDDRDVIERDVFSRLERETHSSRVYTGRNIQLRYRSSSFFV